MDLTGQTSLIGGGLSDQPKLSSQSAAWINFSFARGLASRKVCIGALPKHERP